MSSKEQRVIDAQFGELERAFGEVLDSLTLRKFKSLKQEPGPDGLFHAALVFDADGFRAILEANRIGPYQVDQELMWLHWDVGRLESAVDLAMKLCPQNHHDNLRSKLRDLAIALYEESDQVDVPPSDNEVVLPIVDRTRLKAQLWDVVEKARSKVRDYIVFVPLEGLAVAAKMIIGDVELREHGTGSELQEILHTCSHEWLHIWHIRLCQVSSSASTTSRSRSRAASPQRFHEILAFPS